MVAHAENAYDDIEEFKYITTIANKEVVPVINEEYDKDKPYIKRSNRNEWIRVH